LIFNDDDNHSILDAFMKDKVIFIHIPKTGGTTINAAMNNSFWQTEVGFNYRHILPNKKSNSGDIFEPENIEKFKAHQIFMMLRHPIDRLTSEYYFIRERKEFIDLLKNKPKDFNSYIKNRQTQNGVTNFLVGRRMYDPHSANKNDLEKVLEVIDELPIHVGIFEYFADSLSYFNKEIGVKWKKDIEVKRMTFKRPQVDELSNEIKNLIKENNQLDLALYEHCLTKFKSLHENLPDIKVNFHKDKYNHVIPYCAKWCFFEFCMENKKFIKQNFEYFKSLTFYLINNKGIRDGKEYTNSWNQTFLQTIGDQFPNTDFYNCIHSVYNKEEDPLEETIKIAKALDDFFTANKNNSTAFYKPLKFKEELVVHKIKKGFFRSLFKN